MGYHKFESDSFCVGVRQRPAIKNNYSDITSNGSKRLIGYRANCNRKKSMTVSANTKQAD